VAEIAPGDFLFIDSSHVGKIGSDVLTELHEMIPRLPPGVHVHLHDIFYPFEYPSYWVYEGRFWNEAYLLRALLTDNPKLQIDCFNSYLATFHLDEMKALLPVWAQNTGGSIWLQTAKRHRVSPSAANRLPGPLSALRSCKRNCVERSPW